MGFHELPVSVEHGQRAGLLPGDHRDPFDRMLIVQSLAENLPVVSNEKLFESHGVQRNLVKYDCFKQRFLYNSQHHGSCPGQEADRFRRFLAIGVERASLDEPALSDATGRQG
jgi:hypothetical protein